MLFEFEMQVKCQSPFTCLLVQQHCLPVSYNVTDYTLTRSLGLVRHETIHRSDEYGTRHMLTTGMFKESCISLVPPPLPVQAPQEHNNRRPQIVDKVGTSFVLSVFKNNYLYKYAWFFSLLISVCIMEASFLYSL